MSIPSTESKGTKSLLSLPLPLTLLAVVVLVSLVFILLKLLTPNIFLYNKEFIDLRTKIENTVFQKPRLKELIFTDFAKAKKTKNDQEAYSIYLDSFKLLITEYLVSRNSQIRELALELKSQVASQFSKYFEEANFQVMCLDLSCGNPSETPAIQEIVKRIQAQVTDQSYKAQLLQLFETASWADASEDSLRFNQYANALDVLNQYIAINNSQELRETARLLRDYLENNYADLFAARESAKAVVEARRGQ